MTMDARHEVTAYTSRRRRKKRWRSAVMALAVGEFSKRIIDSFSKGAFNRIGFNEIDKLELFEQLCKEVAFANPQILPSCIQLLL